MAQEAEAIENKRKAGNDFVGDGDGAEGDLPATPEAPAFGVDPESLAEAPGSYPDLVDVYIACLSDGRYGDSKHRRNERHTIEDDAAGIREADRGLPVRTIRGGLEAINARHPASRRLGSGPPRHGGGCGIAKSVRSLEGKQRKYRYDRRANPYNRGVVENFKEIFFTSIPPSKNKFRARVPREQEYQQLTTGGGFMSPNMGRAVGDIEMGRKPVTWDELRAITQGSDLEEGLSNRNMGDDKDSELGEVSPDLRREFLSARGVEVQAALHHRRSSWGRGGSWETMPEVRAVASAMWETSRIGSGSGSGSRSMSAANL
ncbi:hypothetical protein BHM03_00030893 [Ensete ventricosum]|nr:hypothetical protein BHM03_00030893 [Ensete ventricosum]